MENELNVVLDSILANGFGPVEECWIDRSGDKPELKREMMLNALMIEIQFWKYAMMSVNGPKGDVPFEARHQAGR